MTTKTPEALSVLDDMASTVQLISAEHRAWHARIVAARAAFAELIEAAKDRLVTDKRYGLGGASHRRIAAALTAVEKLK